MSRTWARSRRAGRRPLQFLQHMLSNDLRRLPEGGAQYSVLCREDGGVLDDLFTYRLAECEFLTVTNAANHEKDLAWLQSHAGEFDVDVIDRADRASRCSPSRGRARGRSSAGLADGNAAAADALLRAVGGRRRDARVRHRLHGRGRRRAAARPARRARGLGRADRAGGAAGRARRARHAAARGLLSPVRQRSQRGPRPDRGRARLVLQGADGLHRLRGASPRCARERPAREARPVRDRRAAGSRARAIPSTGGGVVTSGTFSPVTRARDRDGVRFPRSVPSRARAIEIDVRGTTRPASVERKPLYRKGS